jgi:hypothetical protein
MPIRLTSRGPFLITYDQQSGRWITIPGITLSVLSQYVEIQPGTSLGRVFDMVDSDQELKRFLGKYCGCDIDAIHQRPREGGEPIQVITSMEKVEDGGDLETEMTVADAVVVEPFFYVHSDEVTGERCLEGNHILMAQSSKNRNAGTSIHSQRDVSFGFLCGLELRLNPVMVVIECDEDKQQESGEEVVAFQASIQYTLLDVLLAVYGFFGEPPYDTRYQRQVDEDAAFIEGLRSRAVAEGETEIVAPTTLPLFNEGGELPLGVHRATLPGVLERFGHGTIQRRAVADRLRRIYQLAASTGHLARFVVFGSFITAKAEPNDVDVILIMEDSFDLASVPGEAALVFQHMAADAHFGASVFWSKRSGAIGGEQAMIEHWQLRRDGGLRGIVEIVGVGP